MLRVGVITAYPGEDWHAERIVAAARKRAEVVELSPLDFTADVDGTDARILVRGGTHEDYDVFLTPRALGEDGDPEVQLELYRTLGEAGALMVNDTRALTTAIDKFRTSWLLSRAGLTTPRAVVAQRVSDGVAALHKFGGRAVAKPLYGSLGIGVALVESEDEIAECLGRWKVVYLQAFVDGKGSDVRLFVVGDQVSASIRRRARPGEFRTNVHQGGIAEAYCPDEKTARLAVAATRTLGLDYAGVDVIVGEGGPTVLEVNGTPLFRGIHDATGLDMAVPVVEHALARAASRRARRTALRRGNGDGPTVAKQGDHGSWPRRARVE